MINVVEGDQTINLESPAFASGDEVPDVHSDYGDGLSPAFRWSGVPDATQSIVLVAEDPDAPRDVPFTHWILYNMPGGTREVPASIPRELRLPQLDGALQGRSSAGAIGYLGPHPPENDPAHHYHFELFCLDAPLELGPGADRD